jgi:hypothetical protein
MLFPPNGQCAKIILEKQLSTKVTKNTNKFKRLHVEKQKPKGWSPSYCNILFYFVPFVFFVDVLPFLGLSIAPWLAIMDMRGAKSISVFLLVHYCFGH